MAPDLDTFLVALYSIVDDLYRAHFAEQRPTRPGPHVRLSDSEVLTLVIVAQWFGCSERAFIRRAHQHWRSYFPNLLSQSAANRRARDLVGVLTALGPLVAAELGAANAVYQVFDGAPVPLLRKCRGKLHRLFGDEAAVGRGGSDKDWYYGCQLLLVTTDQGLVAGFLLAPASTEGHWLAEALLCWRADPSQEPWGVDDLPPSHRRGGSYVGPTGPIWPRAGVGSANPAPYISDGGFAGVHWTMHWQQDYQACVLTPLSYQGETAEAAKAQHRAWRHVIETVNDQLEQVLHLAFPLAHTCWGLWTRIAAKLAAFNLGVWLNRMFGRPDFALATLFSC